MTTRTRFASRYLLLSAVVSSALASIGACTASGGLDPFNETEAGATEPEPTVSLPGPSDDGNRSVPPSDAAKDATKKDGSKDAAQDADAGAWGPDPGEACPVVNQIIKRKCGLCGTEEAVCLFDPDGGAGGIVSPYSPCTNQIDGGCMPGSTQLESCGNCGTRTRVCTTACTWTAPACQNEPPGSCTPTLHDYTSAGCIDGGTYRARDCKSTCTWTGFSATCNPLDFELTVSSTAGAAVSGIYPLRASLVDKRITGTCTSASLSSATNYPYVYVELVNPSDKALTVSVWNTQAPNGPIIDTLMAAYAGNARPTTDAERKACLNSIVDYCPAALPCGSTQWAGLTGSNAVVIPAFGSALIWFGAYSAAGGGATVEGNVTLVVRTDSVQ